jgi:cytochrome c oxidase assembly factor CtaG
VLLVLSIALLIWYLRTVSLLRSSLAELPPNDPRRWSPAEDFSPWPARRAIWFIGGLVLVLLATSGPVADELPKLFWIWLSQSLLLLLLLPIPIVAGQPVELVRRVHAATGRTPALLRFADAGPGRFFASPIVGAGLIPIACVVFLFGPVPAWSIQHTAVGWLIQTALLAVGLVIVLPLISTDTTTSSLAFGAAIAIGLVELLVDAVPGIVMRLSTHPVTSYFDFRHAAGQLSPLSDQQLAGGILWCVAELLDLPFMVLIFRRWIQADAREAAVIDAQTAAYGPTAAEPASPGDEPTAVVDETPWFLTDPQLRDRFR